MDKEKIKRLYSEVWERIETIHINCFEGMDKPLFLISQQYPGIWLEHVYDSILYACMNKKGIDTAKNTINLFIDNQREDGQLPCYVLDKAKVGDTWGSLVKYTQIQECVSFAKLCLMVYELSGDKELLLKSYKTCEKWVKWLTNNRMTTNRGLVEMFYGFDTGHDNSGRLDGISCKGNYVKDGKEMNAAVIPPDDDVAPVLAVDMNANFYATNKALARMAEILDYTDKSILWEEKARKVKENLFKYCYDEEDAFFYDVDKHGNKRKYRSCAIFHMFMEGVLDEDEDRDIIDRIYNEHIKNPEEFWTEYPFPSMAVNDSSAKNHTDFNCWGYYTQGLIVKRCTLWMDKYGYSEDFDLICERWIEAWTDSYDNIKFAQEIDPHTGKPTRSSEWYSACMLFYVYSVQRLKLL